MGVHTVIAATIPSTHQHNRSESHPTDHWPSTIPHIRQIDEQRRLQERQANHYGAVASGSSSSSPLGSSPSKESPKVQEPEYSPEEDRRLAEEEEGDEVYEEVAFEPIIDVTWRYMSRMYLLVPVFTMLVFIGLILLVTYAWPPSRHERQGGQIYPHPILPWPFLTGLFASVTVQAIRVPVWVITSWLPLSSTKVTMISTILHTALHESIRLATLPMIRPSPTSGFHSSYYLGLGWGLAEAIWGIVQGWEQLVLYEDVMRPERDVEVVKGLGLEDVETGSDLDVEELEEAELERRVEILERMRGRRDLEQILGVPFPNIPFPFHLLWRLDTLLLNLGLTLILSSYYFNSYPIYRHAPYEPIHTLAKAPHPGHRPSPYLWVAWCSVATLHVALSLVWKIVGRIGMGSVTWGGLIVSLGSVFAGLGGWGGLV